MKSVSASLPPPTASEENLAQHAQKSSVKQPLSQLKNSVIHVDGVYLSLWLSNLIESKGITGTEGPLESFATLTKSFFDTILGNDPASLTIWFTNASDMVALTFRINLGEARIKHSTAQSVLFPPGLLFGWLKLYNKDRRIQPVWSSHNGEEAIPSAILHCDVEGPFFIFSGNAVFYKYEFGHSQVYMTDIDEVMDQKMLTTIQVSQVHQLVPKEKRIVSRACEYADVIQQIPPLASNDYCFGAHGFLNRFHHLNSVLSFLIILYDSPVWPAWKIGEKYRSYAYSSVLEQYFQHFPSKRYTPNQYKSTECTEYTRVGDHYVPTPIPIFCDKKDPSSKEYYDYQTRLGPEQLGTVNGVISSIVSDIQSLPGPHRIDDRMIHVIVDYLDELFEHKMTTNYHNDEEISNKSLDRLTNSHPEVIRVHAQLEAAVYSLMLLDNCRPGLVVKQATGLVLWRMNLCWFFRIYLRHHKV